MTRIKIIKKKPDYRAMPYKEIPSAINACNVETLNRDFTNGTDREQLMRTINKHRIGGYRHLAYVRNQAIDRLVDALFTKQKDSQFMIDRHIQYLTQFNPQVQVAVPFRRKRIMEK